MRWKVVLHYNNPGGIKTATLLIDANSRDEALKGLKLAKDELPLVVEIEPVAEDSESNQNKSQGQDT
jgi:hypothetical protein